MTHSDGTLAAVSSHVKLGTLATAADFVFNVASVWVAMAALTSAT